MLVDPVSSMRPAPHWAHGLRAGAPPCRPDPRNGMGLGIGPNAITPSLPVVNGDGVEISLSYKAAFDHDGDGFRRDRTFASLSPGARQAGFPNMKWLLDVVTEHSCRLLPRKEKTR